MPFSATATLLAALQVSVASPPITMELDVRVPMRDGVTLSADIYRPAGTERVPTVLVRTPYDNGTGPNVVAGRRWARNGYAYVVQDVRGRGDSDGTFYPWTSEGDDGYDTIEWIAEQPWSDGQVGMMGGSYLGWTQMYAAIQRPPALKALIPSVTPADPDRGWPVQAGAYQPTTMSWLALTSGRTMQNISEHDLAAANNHLPLYEADRVLGRTLTPWRDWLDHPRRDEYWEALSFQGALRDVTIPMLHVSGWYDDVLVGTTENFALLKERNPQQYLLIGPWGHQINQRQVGAVDFGPDAVIDLDSIYGRWFDHWLKGRQNGVPNQAKVRIFVMEENRWRDESDWPLPRTRFVKYYLSSGGHANSRFGDGRLDTIPPASQSPDRFRSDPADTYPYITMDAYSQIGGPDDYREAEERNDVLVYSTDPLPEPMEVCGPLSVRLYAASSARDTDWATKVLAVRPNGIVQRLNDGLVRARFRKGFDQPLLLEPGTVEEYEIDNWSTCIRVGAGWRIRLEVASHAFPKFDRNMQTGGPIGKEDQGVVADQEVYHEPDRASYLLLPIVDALGNRR